MNQSNKALRDEVAELLDDTIGEIDRPEQVIALVTNHIKGALLERAEQKQVLVGWKKDRCHTPIHQAWQAISLDKVHQLLKDMGGAE